MANMKEYLKKYSETNPEKFNKEFILSKNDDGVLEYVTDIFKSLEVIEGVKVRSVKIDSNEETFGPIRMQSTFYKALMPSRLNKIHFVIDIEGRQNPIEQDLFINKLIYNSFYINEGKRFFPVWQIVDNFCYKTNNGISMKSLLNPFTIINNGFYNQEPEFGKEILNRIPCYETLIFGKQVPLMVYVMSKFALDSFEQNNMSPDNGIEEFETFKDLSLFDKFNEFFEVNFKFAEKPEDLIEDGRVIFRIKENKSEGVCFSVEESLLEDSWTKNVIGMLLNSKLPKKDGNNNKRKKVMITYEEFYSPYFWIHLESDYFIKSGDVFKRLKKAKDTNNSLEVLMSESTKKSIPLQEEYKKDTFATMKYVQKNFTEIFNIDGMDLDNKRLRLYEYIFHPLRAYFKTKIDQIINEPTRSVQSIEKIFSSLSPMFIIKNLTNEKTGLLRFYNASNEFCLFSCLCKASFKGPQALGSSISKKQRDLDESYVGRIGLVAASPGDPGTVVTLVPFLKTYDGYFDQKAYCLAKGEELPVEVEEIETKAEEKSVDVKKLTTDEERVEAYKANPKWAKFAQFYQNRIDKEKGKK